MKKRLLILVLSCMTSICILHAEDLYVAMSGSDNNPGTEASPLASISQALTILESGADGSTIWLNEGLYNISSGMSLQASHSGLTIRAMEGKNVVISGGKPVDGHLFEKISGSEAATKLPSVARNSVYVAELPDELADVFPTKESYDKTGTVTWNGYRLNIAQYPNKGFTTIGNVLDAGPTSTSLPYSEDYPIGGTFQLTEEIDWTMLASEFARTKDMIISGYVDNDWLYEVHRVGAIDASAKTIKLLRWTRYGIEGESNISLERRIRIIGALSQLDQPGEWYFDRTDNKLYIWPIQPMNSQNPITLLNDIRFFSGANVNDVTIRDITFQNFGDIALYFDESNNLTIAGCTFRSSDGMGIRMMKGINNTILSCDFYNMYQAFVMTGLASNRMILADENNRAINNYIHDCSFKGYGLAAILGVGGEFKNNVMHDVNGAFKYADANDINVEYNEFYNVGYEMGDWNVIYANDDYATRGNYIKHNFFHHMMEVPGSHGLAAMRQDGEATGVKFESNILYKTGRSAVQLMGADNSVSKNVVMETQNVFHTRQAPYYEISQSEWEAKTDYLAGWKEKQDQLQVDIADGTKNFSDIENRTAQGEAVFGTEGWLTNELWKGKYPNFAHTFDMYNPDGSPYTNAYIEVVNNYSYNGKSFPFAFHGGNTVEDLATVQKMLPSTSTLEDANSFNPDNMFNNPSIFDFTFKSEFTPVAGFDKWDFDSVGMYVDEYRRVTPDKNEYRTAIKNKYDGIKSSGGSFNLATHNQRYPEPDYLQLEFSASLLSSSPALYFLLDESSGGNIADKVNGDQGVWQNGISTNLEWKNGMFYNGAALAGGSDEYFSVQSDAFANTEALTISLWLKPNVMSGNQGLVSTGSASNDWGLELDGPTINAKANGSSLSASSALTIDQWSYVVMTWSNSGVAKLYVNGEEKSSTESAPISYTDQGQWNFGALTDGQSTYSGMLDDIAMFDVALSAEDIKLIYITGQEGIAASTIAPISVSTMDLNLTYLNLRDDISGALSTEVMPSNAANQEISWRSTDPSIVTVDDKGNFKTVGLGTAYVIASTIDGDIADSCEFVVVEEISSALTAPVAYWPFDETAGDTAVDVIAGHTAVWAEKSVAQQWEEGYFSRSATFTGGDNDRFVIGSDPIAGTDSFSISVWFNLDVTSIYEGLVTTRDLNFPNENKDNWGFSAERNHIDARWDSQAIDGDDAIFTGAWYNVVVVWDNSGSRKLYVNGELIGESASGPTTYNTNNTWFLGDDLCCGGREIDGRMDELKMYDKVLTADEIAYMYTLSKLGISYMDLSSIRAESVKIHGEDLSLKVNENKQMSATLLPEDASSKVILWSVLNTNVATVDNSGQVTAITPGNTKLIATALDGGVSDTIGIRVNFEPVTSIEISEDTLTLMEGDRLSLNALVKPFDATDKTFTWKSTDVNVVTVDQSGYTIAKGAGNAYIVATSRDSDISDSCLVNVDFVHVSSVALDMSDLDVTSGAEIYLTPTVLPLDAKNKDVTWSSSDETVVSVFGEGYFDALKIGTVVLKVFTIDGDFTDSCIVRVDGGASAIKEELIKEGITMYPNPVENVLNISVKDISIINRIDILNSTGKVVNTYTISSTNDQYDVSNLCSGCYLVRFHAKDKIVTYPLIKTE